MRAQAYDGAATMKGTYTGVAKRLLEHEPHVLYFHCLAHNLNLCLKDASKNTSTVKQALDFVTQISNVIRASPKRFALFQQLRNQAGTDTLGCKIRPLCPTRWTVRSDALNGFLKNYYVIEEELEIIADSNSEVGACANGLAIVF